MTERVACNLCGSDDAKPLFRLRDYRLRVDEREWSAVQCRRCGLGYLNPRPDPVELAAYYPPGYFDQRRTHLERYRRQADYVPGPPGTLLDVGTARGDFLAVMRDRGWSVEGIEPAESAGNPHGLTVHRVPFPEGVGQLLGSDFDVVTAWATFEHLRDPAAAFRAVAGLLRPGGRLVLQVPNLRSIYSRWALQEDVPRHLYFFSEKTLRAFGVVSGLQLERVVHTTDLFGGSGRGIARLMLVRATGGSTEKFFDILQTPRRERFRRWPLLTLGWVGASALERLLLTDALVRRARISGQIVAYFRKPPPANA